jgi:hypothetical protein
MGPVDARDGSFGGLCEPVGLPLGRNGLEGPILAFQDGGLAGEVLPALDRDIDILAEQFDGMAGAAGHFGRNDGRTGSAERLIHGLTGRGIVLDRPLHAFDRLLCAVLEAWSFAGRDLPHR